MKRRLMASVLVCFAAMALPASGHSQQTRQAALWFNGWPQPGHDPQRTYRSPTVGPAIRPHLLFRKKDTTVSVVSPAGTMYGAAPRARHGLLYTPLVALDETGRILWTYVPCRKPCSYLSGPLALTPDGVLVSEQGWTGATASDSLAGFDPSGHLRWTIEPLGADKQGRPLVTAHGEFYAFVAHPGRCWTVSTAVNPHTLDDATLDVDTDTGALERCFVPPGGDDAMAPNGTHYAMAGSELVAYTSSGNASTSAIQWQTRTPGKGLGADFPLVTDSGMIVVGLGQQLVAVHPDGAMAWRVHTADGVRTLAEGINGVVYAAGKHHLIAVTAQGSVLWTRRIGPVGSRSLSSSVVTDGAGNVYTGSADGRVRIFSPEGVLLAKLTVGRRAGSSPELLIADGRLVVNGTDGTLRVYGH